MKSFRLTKTPEQKQSQEIKESKNLEGLNEFFSLLSSVPEKREVVKEAITEDVIYETIAPIPEQIAPPVIDNTTFVDSVAASISKTVTHESVFELPNAAKPDKDIAIIQKKIQDMQNWLSKITMAGPGSGEVNFRWLDDVDRSTIGNTDQILRYNPTSKKFFFGQLSGDQGPIKSLTFDQNGPGVTAVPGMVTWNKIEDCLDIHHADGTILQAGLEEHTQVWNNSAVVIPNGAVLYFDGVHFDGEETPIAKLYIADGSVRPLMTMGIATSDILPNSFGRATKRGKIHGINTTGSDVGQNWNVGDMLWASDTIPGKMTIDQPTAPKLAVYQAVVLKKHATEGVVLTQHTVFPRLYYANYFDTTDQTAAAINTPYKVKYDSVDIASGFHLDAAKTQIIAENHGLYNFSFSAQVKSTNSSTSSIWIWYRKGTAGSLSTSANDVPYTATEVTISSNTAILAPAWNFAVSLQPNEYFELLWAVNSTTVKLAAPTPTAFCPAVPSILMSVTQVNL